MLRKVLSKALLAVALLHSACLLNGCGDAAPADERAARGILTMPLVTTVGAHTYHLQGQLTIYGSNYPYYQYLNLNTDDPALTTAMATGDYTAYLQYWSLTRDDGNGGLAPVNATLVSASQAPFTIFNRATATLSFEFETDGELVTMGAGNLAIDVQVHESVPVCTPLGTDCPAGNWCAPSELTGAALRCIPEGNVLLGAACRSPLDCAANASCYDLGQGPVCIALCASADFNLPCAAGGTCTAQGIDYGMCVPSPSDPGDLGGGGGQGGASP